MRLKNIYLRFNAGSQTGMGHWYRCLALLDVIKKKSLSEIVLLVNPLPETLIKELKQKNIRFLVSSRWGELSQMEKVLSARQNSLIVIDTLNTQEDYIKKLTRLARVITIGGSGKGRNYANVRIDGMIPRKNYADGFTGEELYIGPEYVILRSIFSSEPSFTIRDKVKRVLVTMGGDAKGAGFLFAEIVSKLFPQFQLDVIAGPFSKTKNSSTNCITVHKFVDNPRSLMESCDLAVTSGGMTAFELMRLGIPLLFVPQTHLQEVASQTFEKAGVGYSISLKDQKNPDKFQDMVRNQVIKLLDYETRKTCSNNSLTIIDGRGVYRVADIIERNLQKVN